VLDVLETAYVEYMASLGINIRPVSNSTKDLDTAFADLKYDGILLTGGGDVGYGLTGDKGSLDMDTHPDRDDLCVRLVELAAARRLPVIAICYGMQLLNCHLGGKLTLDIHGGAEARTPGMPHTVTFDAPGLPVGKGEYKVNHYHNHGISKSGLAGCLEAIALDEEFGVVEGYVHRELPMLGIQWHPERPSPDEGFNRGLITGFLKDAVSKGAHK